MSDQTRHSLEKAYPDGLKAMMSFTIRRATSALDPRLTELIKIRGDSVSHHLS
ncbi:MAG: hypothetical protein ABI368_06680 [Jatrophihabitantaceae bacterium]